MKNNSYNDYFLKAQKLKGIRNDNQLSFKGKSKPKAKSKKIKDKENKSINLSLTGLFLCGFLITLFGGLYIDDVIKVVQNIEFGFLGQANAEVISNNKGTSENEVKKDDSITSDNGVNVKNESEKLGEDKKLVSTEDIELNHLSRLKERKLELDKREEEITKLEDELGKQRQEIELKLKELEEIRRSISSTLETKVQADDQKIQDLVQFYSNMKPPQAAKILESLDESLVVKIIEKMKKKSAAEIMNLMKPEKAQAISEKYAGYRK